MAYQKTGGRSVTVQPTGMPDLSGFFESARQLQEIGNLANSIGTDIRKREYNDLLRQAEIDGSTAGAVFVDGKLQPLVNFDYDKATQTYSESDQKSILRAYKASAIRTYVSAASNDIDRAAEDALLANPSNPNGIRGALDGYMEGLSDVDPQIKAALMPKAVQAFGVAENRAKAKLQDETKKNAIYQNSKAFQALSVEKGKLIASMQDSDSQVALAVNKRIKEINEEQDQIVDTLSLNEVSAESISKIRDADRTVVAARVGQSLIRKTYAAEGDIKAYEAYMNMVEESQSNSNVNSEAIAQIGRETLRSLQEVDRLSEKAQTDMREVIYNDLMARIVVDKIDISNFLLDPSSDIFKLDGGQQATLVNMSESVSKSKADIIKQANSRLFQDNLAVISNPQQFTSQAVRSALSAVSDMRFRGDITLKEMIEARDKFFDAQKYFSSGAMKELGAKIQIELGPRSTYMFEPSHYDSEDMMKALEAKGVIGEGGYYTTRKEYINEVDAYAKNFKEKREKHQLAISAESKLKRGVELSSKELSAYTEIFNFDKVRIQDESGQDALVPLDLFSSDDRVVRASMDAVSNYTVITKGSIHSDVKSLLEAIRFRPDNADLALRIVGQSMSGLRNAFKGESFENVEAQFYSNLDTDTVVFLRMAQKVGLENTVNAFAGFEKGNLNRSVSEYLTNNQITGDENSFFEDTFRKSIDSVNFWSLMTPVINEEDAQMYRQMAQNSGFSNTVGTVLSDPYIKDYLKKEWYGRILPYGDKYDPVAAMHDSLKKLGTRVGLERNPATGKIELVSNPILRQAQSTIPANAGIQITMNDVRNDFISRFKSVRGMISSDLVEKLNDIVDVGPSVPLQGLFGADIKGTSTLHFFPNESYGGRQTYTVALRTGIGDLIPLSNNYSYDFAQSEAYKDTFPKVIEKLKTKNGKAIVSAMGLFDQSFVQGTFERMERNKNDQSLIPLINGYNQFQSYFGGDTIDTLTKEEVDDIFNAFEAFGINIMRLGF